MHAIQQHARSNKQCNEFQDLLDGPQFDDFVTDFLGGVTQVLPPVWKPDIYHSLSENFTDSPASSYTSSSSCSPWASVSGLSLDSSPEFQALEDLTRQYPSSLYFPSSEDFRGLSLGSPIQLTYPGGSIDPNALALAPTDLSDPAGLFSNALALDFSADNIAHALGSQEPHIPSLPLYANNPVVVPNEDKHNSAPQDADAQPQASGTVSGFDFAIIARVNCARPAQTPSPATSPPNLSFLSVDPCANKSVSSALQVRASRRRTSRIDYNELGNDEDSDDEWDATEDSFTRYDHSTQKQQQQQQQQQTLKKKRSRTFTARGSDDEDESSASSFSHADEMGGARRGVPSRGGRRCVSLSSGCDSKQRKVKRRHPCIKSGCFATFTRITDMERHVASVHRAADTDENRCRFCMKAFSREDAVLRHENDSCPSRPKKTGVIKASTMAETWA